MFQKLVNKVYSQPSKPPFYKALKKALSTDKSPLSDALLSELLSGFKSPETSAFAMQALLSKIAKSSKKWVPLIKSLTVLDLLLENDIQLPMGLDCLIKYHPSKPKHAPYDNFFQQMTRYLQEKARLYQLYPQRLSLYAPNPQKTGVFFDFAQFQSVHDLAFEVIAACEQGLTKNPLIQAVFNRLLTVLYGFYQLQMQGFEQISQKFFGFELEKATEIRTSCEKFMENTKELISFINRHQFLKLNSNKSVEIELFQPKKALLQSFDDYIAVLRKKQEKQQEFGLKSEGGIVDPYQECDVPESERDIATQRKRDIFESPIRAHFMNRNPYKPCSNPVSPQKERYSLPEPLQTTLKSQFMLEKLKNTRNKYKFCENNDLYCPEVFEGFQNHYSQTYRGSIRLEDYGIANFDLQLKLNSKEKVLFRSQTLDPNEAVGFLNFREFHPKLFEDFSNCYSRDFEKNAVFLKKN